MIDIEDIGEKVSKCKGYKEFPLWIVAVVNFCQYSAVVVASFLYFNVTKYLTAIYILMTFRENYSTMSEGCTNCYYYGKWCSKGLGKVAKFVFKKGDLKTFACRKVTFKNIIPILIAQNGATLCGIYLSIARFNWLFLLGTVYMLLHGAVITPALYGNLSCPSCKMRDFCPALKVFQKDTTPKSEKKK